MSFRQRIRQQYLHLISRLFIRARVIDHNRNHPVAGQVVYVIESGRSLHRHLLNQLNGSCQGRIIALKRGQLPPEQDINSLIVAQRQNPLLDYQLIPVGIYHGRMPRREKNWFRLLFSESWISHSGFMFALRILINGRHTLIRISPPLSLQQISETEAATAQLTEQITGRLNLHFHISRKTMLGPDLSHRRTLVEKVINTPSLRQVIQQQSQLTGAPVTELEARCRTHLQGLAADLNPATSRVLHKLLNIVWQRLYQKIRVISAEPLQQNSDGRQLVYLPCHRSHMDYLLLSYMLFEHGLMLPHIAAGDNLNIPVVGPLLRRGGAIFMRRRFRGDQLYPECFKAYLSVMAKKGHSLEYFIEGGRSRTGRLLPPKTGLLRMTVENFLAHPEQKVSLVPVWISYDRLIETNSYQRELSGAPKRKESFGRLFSSLGILKQNYGEASLSFGTPIPLSKAQLCHSLNSQNSCNEQVTELAHQVMREINNAAVVNSPALLATVLLANPTDLHPRQGINQQLTDAVALLQRVPNAPKAMPEQQPEQWLDHAIRIGILDQPKDNLFTIDSRQYGELANYRNNIQHLLIMPGLILLLIQRLKAPGTTSLAKFLTALYPYLRNELFLPWPDSNLGRELHGFLSALQNHGMISKQGRRWQLNRSPFALTLIQTAEPTLLRYYICLLLLHRFARMPKDELITLCAEIAGQAHTLYGFSSDEYGDPKVFNSFIELQCQQGLLCKAGNIIHYADREQAENLFRHAGKILRPQMVAFLHNKIHGGTG